MREARLRDLLTAVIKAYQKISWKSPEIFRGMQEALKNAMENGNVDRQDFAYFDKPDVKFLAQIVEYIKVRTEMNEKEGT